MKYKKCSRCQLNYITEDQEFCGICLREMRGEKDEFDDISYDICPYCDKNILTNGEDMCKSCRIKRMKKQNSDEI